MKQRHITVIRQTSHMSEFDTAISLLLDEGYSVYALTAYTNVNGSFLVAGLELRQPVTLSGAPAELKFEIDGREW